jgi:hypothetical protein
LHVFSKNFRGVNNLVSVALQSQSYLSSKIRPNCVNIPHLSNFRVLMTCVGPPKDILISRHFCLFDFKKQEGFRAEANQKLT